MSYIITVVTVINALAVIAIAYYAAASHKLANNIHKEEKTRTGKHR